MARASQPKPSEDTNLGSIVASPADQGDRVPDRCNECGSSDVARVVITLPDEREVSHVSCRSCEHQYWIDPDKPTEALAWKELVTNTDHNLIIGRDNKYGM